MHYIFPLDATVYLLVSVHLSDSIWLKYYVFKRVGVGCASAGKSGEGSKRGGTARKDKEILIDS